MHRGTPSTFPILQFLSSKLSPTTCHAAPSRYGRMSLSSVLRHSLPSKDVVAIVAVTGVKGASWGVAKPWMKFALSSSTARAGVNSFHSIPIPLQFLAIPFDSIPAPIPFFFNSFFPIPAPIPLKIFQFQFPLPFPLQFPLQ